MQSKKFLYFAFLVCAFLLLTIANPRNVKMTVRPTISKTSGIRIAYSQGGK